MENQDRTAGEFCQAVIENVFLLKDGSIVAGCNLLSGTVKTGDRLYYVDCIGRECFPLTVAGIALPKKGAVSVISAGDHRRDWSGGRRKKRHGFRRRFSVTGDGKKLRLEAHTGERVSSYGGRV